MIFYKSKDFQSGLKVEIDNQPYSIIENKFVNPGKGQAFNKIKLKNIINENVITKTIKIGEKLKAADITNTEAYFLYKTDDIFFFINENDSTSYEVEKDKVQENELWLKSGVVYLITLWNEKIISIKPPKILELKVTETDNTEKNSVIAKNFKYAKLETGANLKVPIFIKENDIIKIDTEKKIYISRIS